MHEFFYYRLTSKLPPKSIKESQDQEEQVRKPSSKPLKRKKKVKMNAGQEGNLSQDLMNEITIIEKQIEIKISYLKSTQNQIIHLEMWKQGKLDKLRKFIDKDFDIYQNAMYRIFENNLKIDIAFCTTFDDKKYVNLQVCRENITIYRGTFYK